MNTFVRVLLVTAVLLALGATAFAQLTPVWQKSAAATSLPSWFGSASNAERGLALGRVGGNERLLVASRTSGNRILLVDPATGDSAGVLPMGVSTISGGALVLNDVEVSADSVVFACNVTTNAFTSPFKIYKWATAADTPVVAVSFTGTHLRLGDKFTVTGSTADNSIVIWAAAAGATAQTVYKFTTANNGASFTADSVVVTVPAGFPTSPSVAPIPGGGFYVNGIGFSPYHYDATGNSIGTISGTILASASNAIRYFEVGGKKFVASFQGAGNASVRVVDVTVDDASASTVQVASTLGANTNTNGTGDVAVKDNGNGTYTVYVLGTNNGYAAYTFNPIKVTYWLNTSTKSDTVRAASQVEVRGGTSPLTWDDASPNMANTAGDYWSITHYFPYNADVAYKYYVSVSGEAGWEDGGDKHVIASKDTVLDLAYFNAGNTPPYAPTDSVDLWLRVQMGSRPDFDPATDAVHARGSFNGWSGTNPLSREGVSKFYSGQVKVPSSQIGDTVAYKFTFSKGASVYWEDAIGDRKAKVGADSTVYWKTFEDKPIVQVSPVNVTFVINSSTVPDTLKPTSFMQLRGGSPPLTWDQTSPVMLTNIGGDYWTTTIQFFPGTSLQFKVFTFAGDTLTVDDYGAGWENNTTDGSGNRIVVVGNADTVLPVQFVNGSPSNQDQYWRPYVPSDSIDVWFRVNMQSNQDFNPLTQYMGVRGSFNAWGPNSLLLAQETQHGNPGSRRYDGTHFYSGVAKIPAADFANTIEYKFVILDANSAGANIVTWEDNILPASDVGGGGNRTILANPAPKDSTLYWKWWRNVPFGAPAVSDTVIFIFRTNVARAINERGFSHGDTIQVRSGYNQTGKEIRTKRLLRQGFTTTYAATDTVVTKIGANLDYQYYVVKNGVDYREIYYDFSYQPRGDARAEKRRVNVTPGLITVQDTATSNVTERRQPRFRNQAPLGKAFAVKYTVDVRPAIYQLKAGSKLVATNITMYVLGDPDSVKVWGVWMNGPAVGGWDVRGGWGPSRRLDTLSKMFDDGTHGDAVTGDSIYTLSWNYLATDVVGQEFKFGIGAFDNEGGFGNNHVENIDTAGASFTLASQFGSIDPVFYNAWDFDNHRPVPVGVIDPNDALPLVYALRQNYPNPFNPSTTIEYTVPTEGVVSLKVFNVLGQEIATLFNGKQSAGSHTVSFDASHLATGVYLYQIKAGDFVSLKKMVLVK